LFHAARRQNTVWVNPEGGWSVAKENPHRACPGGLRVWKREGAATPNGSPWLCVGGACVGVVVLKPVSHRHEAGGEEP